ncbi:putative ubiquitin fusion degradation protein [Beauveria bassiana]|nr:putative ubiquitin fusion degradation protein [Beauveria bassiana]KAH8709593.1 putative ubiquitin fusion degradation protein C12B10.01c [Beauveria bassiana]
MAERTPAGDYPVPLSPDDAATANTARLTPVAPQRSSARQAASQVAQTSAAPNATRPTSESADRPTSPNTPLQPPRSKRKASAGSKLSADIPRPSSSDRRSKRQKIPEDTATALPLSANTKAPPKGLRKEKTSAIMDGSSDRDAPREPTHDNSSDSLHGRASRSKKSTHSPPDIQDEHSSLSRRSKRLAADADEDIVMGGTDASRDDPESIQHASTKPADETDGSEDGGNGQDTVENHDGEEGDEEEDDDDDDDDDDENDHGDAFGDHDDGDPFGAFGAAGLSSTLRALTGMMSGLTARLRELLNNLREDDLSLQVIALQELSELLLVSNEDNLAGHFSPDAFVRELVQLMNKEESPEVMLLACRCLANLMEALPASVANVVYGNAVPVLCSKLLEISFIDLAEQSLSTLEKISVEYPSSIVREGGLTACLSYLDFFATSTQRTAVTIAANCCRNIPDDSFPVVRDVMPILLNVLSSNDQRVVEQASLCVSGIVESFKHQATKLEELVSVDLLRAVLRLLVPGTTNLIGSSIHTQFLRVLAFTARASPRLSAELFKLHVVETLYQILTGVSPPSGTEDVASKLDSVVIMQALIHRPREQIIETLNVICELLPGLPKDADPMYGDFVEFNGQNPEPTSAVGDTRQSPAEKRLSLLDGCKDEVRRFALIIFPTLTDVFSSTVNLSVRQKVLQAQIKMLSNLDEKILEESLVPVPYASFLASILSQQDHPSLVMLGLQATELLLSRLDRIYRYQLYREGVVLEIEKLSTQVPEESAHDLAKKGDDDGGENSPTSEDEDEDEDHDDEEGEGNHGEETAQAEQVRDEPETAEPEDEEDEDHNNQDQDENVGDESPVSSSSSSASEPAAPPRRYLANTRGTKAHICQVAKKFLESHENEDHSRDMKAKASLIMDNLTKLAGDLEKFYLQRTSADLSPGVGRALFARLAAQFDTDPLESVTSAELLSSGLVRSLMEVLSNPDEDLARLAQSTFLEVFMGKSIKSKSKTATAESPVTPFSMMIHKLQDLLSRSEHYEVVTVHHNTFDGNRTSPASMLGKQIRLRLEADDDSNIPRPYRNIMVSIHAIATFRSLDDYLRPRISLSERPRIARRDGITQALAAMAGLPLGGTPGSRLADSSPFSPGSVPPPPPLAGMSPGTPHLRRAVSSKPPRHPTTPTSADQTAGPSRSGKSLRRSSRRQATSSDPRSPAKPARDEDEAEQSNLECADEKQISEDDEDIADSSALDAIVGELQDMDEEPVVPTTNDPSAIDFEVAPTGGVTARKEDGTKIATPSSEDKRPARQKHTALTSTPAGSSRPMSYASALQSVPQDWHIEFTLDDKVISNETTIYRAIFMSATKTEDQLISRSIWSATHPIKFKRVPGPPAVAPTSVTTNTEAESESPDGIPASLAKNPTTASILRLLNILHELNENIEDVLITNDHQTVSLNVEPPSQFVSTKLTAKLNRQLEEPLIVASSCLPSWSEDLARLYPFLFPFETRHLFLQSTSFGYARSMARWQNAQAEDNRRDRHNERPFLGRLQRQKVRISRLKILESALKVMELYGASQSILEVEYFEEVGTGLGPTLEFYSTVSKEFAKKKLRLWRDIDSPGSDEFVSGPSGLFPRPLSAEELGTPNGERILHLFKMLGKFIARSMIDSRIIDIHFNPIFFRISDAAAAGVKPSLGAVKVVDPGLARSLKAIKKYSIAKKAIDEDPNRTPAQKVADTENICIDGVRLDDLCLDFTLPGYPGIELETNGSQKRVTIDNVDAYLDKVIDMTLGSGVRAQVDAFGAGFSQVFPYSALSAFTPAELVALFGKVNEDWSLETLTDSIKADHGFNMDSRSVKNLLQVMSEFALSERREFLQFITGSPKLPIGGFRSLTPMFTVVCKPSEHPYTSDDYLPSVMTCVNYLKLPDYTDHDTMRRRLLTAMKEGQGAFHLS